MSRVFTFDASACTGCKACQAACKDTNDLPVGILWRRVVEVSGGEWSRSGGAWSNNIFAYNLSMACNHCVHPKCAGVCPTNAYHVRTDGVVILDSTRCAGCNYCNWACPYAVPQYDSRSGFASKCNFCATRIDDGLEPACVAACPMRALGFTSDGVDVDASLKPLWLLPAAEHPFPFPEYSRTQPHVLLKPHPAMANGISKQIANREEILPGSVKSEWPLVAFTLLAQMAAGACWAGLWQAELFRSNHNDLPAFFQLFSGLVLVACLGLAILFAFGHLGTKRNFFRMAGNLKKSWLSKEVVLAGLFGLALVAFTFASNRVFMWLSAGIGFALVYSMAQVYSLRSMPGWNNWRTLASFIVSAVLLGQQLMVLLILFGSQITATALVKEYTGWIGYFSAPWLIFELAMEFTANKNRQGPVTHTRIIIISLVILGCISGSLLPANLYLSFFSVQFGLLLAEEIIGRDMFYKRLNQRRL